MAKAVKKSALKAAKKPAARKSAGKKATGKNITKKPALKVASKTPVKAVPSLKKAVAPPKTQSSPQSLEPVGMWKLLADKKAQANARRESRNEHASIHEDDRNRFAKHDTRFAKFAGPRRRAS